MPWIVAYGLDSPALIFYFSDSFKSVIIETDIAIKVKKTHFYRRSYLKIRYYETIRII